jgi:hypothetical protein
MGWLLILSLPGSHFSPYGAKNETQATDFAVYSFFFTRMGEKETVNTLT